jgi:hypothetical protein
MVRNSKFFHDAYLFITSSMVILMSRYFITFFHKNIMTRNFIKQATCYYVLVGYGVKSIFLAY